jgi:hypothetical protein
MAHRGTARRAFPLTATIPSRKHFKVGIWARSFVGCEAAPRPLSDRWIPSYENRLSSYTEYARTVVGKWPTCHADAPLPRKGYPLPISFLPAPIRAIMHPGRGGSRILPRQMTAIVLLGNAPSPPRAWSGTAGRYEIGPYTGVVGKG